MASLGLPIIGDPLYPERDRRGARRLLARRCSCWRTASSSTIRSADVCAGLSAGAVSSNDMTSRLASFGSTPSNRCRAKRSTRSCSARRSGRRPRVRIRRRRDRQAGQRQADPSASEPLLDCRARFLSPPTVEGAAPPVEVTFPDGTVVRTDDDDGAELTRRAADLLGREVRLISTVPEGLALDELIPQIEGLARTPWRHCRPIRPTVRATASSRFRSRWPRRARCWTWPPCTCWPPARCADSPTSIPTGIGIRGGCGPTS